MNDTQIWSLIVRRRGTLYSYPIDTGNKTTEVWS